MDHAREPIPHTCPDIDKYIKSIKGAMEHKRYLKNMDIEELFRCACDMSDELEDCIERLEILRESNHRLREWGLEEAIRVDELELKYENAF